MRLPAIGRLLIEALLRSVEPWTRLILPRPRGRLLRLLRGLLRGGALIRSTKLRLRRTPLLLNSGVLLHVRRGIAGTRAIELTALSSRLPRPRTHTIAAEWTIRR